VISSWLNPKPVVSKAERKVVASSVATRSNANATAATIAAIKTRLVKLPSASALANAGSLTRADDMVRGHGTKQPSYGSIGEIVTRSHYP